MSKLYVLLQHMMATGYANKDTKQNGCITGYTPTKTVKFVIGGLVKAGSVSFKTSKVQSLIQ